MARCLVIVTALAASCCASANPALEQCRQRVMDYAWYWDHGDTTGFAGIFTEDARLSLGDETLTGRQAIVERLAAAERGPIMRHAMSTVRVTRTGETSARGVSYLTLYVADPVDEGLPSVAGFTLLGEYHDTFRIVADDCRIEERRLVPVLRRRGP